MFEFETKIESKDISVFHFAEFAGMPLIDFDTTCHYTKVKWRADVDARSWGINGITAMVDSVETSVHWRVDADDLTEEDKVKLREFGGTEMRDDSFEGEKELKVEAYKEEDKDEVWGIENNIEVADEGYVQVSDIQIDFSDKTIYVT